MKVWGQSKRIIVGVSEYWGDNLIPLARKIEPDVYQTTWPGHQKYQINFVKGFIESRSDASCWGTKRKSQPSKNFCHGILRYHLLPPTEDIIKQTSWDYHYVFRNLWKRLLRAELLWKGAVLIIISQRSLALPFISNITWIHCLCRQGINDFFLLTYFSAFNETLLAPCSSSHYHSGWTQNSVALPLLQRQHQEIRQKILREWGSLKLS